MVGVSDALLASIAADEALMPRAAEEILARNAAEPYRRKLSYVWERLDPEGEAPYADPDEMIADLRVVEASLLEHRGERIARRGLARLLRQVEIFGFHTARLDVRQHSSRLREAADALAAGPPEAMSPAAAEVVETFRELRRAIDVHGPRAAGTVIVSFTHEAEDLLAPLALARHVGPGARGGRPPALGRRPGAPVRDHRRPAPRPGDAAQPARTRPTTGATWRPAATARS